MGKFQVRGVLLTSLVGAAVLSQVIALILILVNLMWVSLPVGYKYGMVFDAGSTHTALFLYKWQGDKQNSTGLVTQVMVCDVDGPGISSYANNPPAAGQSLKVCLDTAAAAVPRENQREAPVYLGATAGMRLLNITSPSQSDQVLAEVAKFIQLYPFDFRGARIISGDEEGAYGWVTINYLLQSFIKCTFEGKWKLPTSAKTLGAMDLGGASTQLTFTPAVPIKDKNYESNFTLYGNKYNVYTHSYLCYGKEQAMKKVQANLIQQQSSSLSNPIDHPCYPTGYQLNTTLGAIFNSPCVSYSGSANLNTLVNFTGTGNASKCQEIIRGIFNFTACGSKTDCTFDGVYQPPISGSFFAFSAFFYTFDILKLTPKASLSVTLDTISKFCQKPWTQLKAEYPTEKEDRLRDYCASGYYITTLLVDGYKFNSTSWDNIQFQKKADDMDIGWTLGYMLNLTNLIPSTSPGLVRGQGPGEWTASIFFTVFSIFLCLLAFSVQCFWKADH
ncbi:ectonucleoside triphosphate diphosphohydrolase 8-like isoform X1 [Erpetoichthys calabaricus]|uniref:ectonucleoside triphosphate diphosphohydrolase 8-like isoform X1 n=1 Tax=Erpetoichthys calabaricus TaxID=27687 RepID=UPI0022343A51|nr:ectonucleoside triphosphate diphosphohydrolase 8-like isoform X1 [Erpetoichthys calabaricus]